MPSVPVLADRGYSIEKDRPGRRERLFCYVCSLHEDGVERGEYGVHLRSKLIFWGVGGEKD